MYLETHIKLKWSHVQAYNSIIYEMSSFKQSEIFMWLPIQKLSSYSLFQAFKGICHISFLNQTKGYAAVLKFLYISLSMKKINQTINRKQNNVNLSFHLIPIMKIIRVAKQLGLIN